MDSPLSKRREVRALILDRRGRVLLLEHVEPTERGLWATPGGARERDETDAEALARELREELGLGLIEASPAWDGTTSLARRAPRALVARRGRAGH